MIYKDCRNRKCDICGEDVSLEELDRQLDELIDGERSTERDDLYEMIFMLAEKIGYRFNIIDEVPAIPEQMVLEKIVKSKPKTKKKTKKK